MLHVNTMVDVFNNNDCNGVIILDVPANFMPPGLEQILYESIKSVVSGIRPYDSNGIFVCDMLSTASIKTFLIPGYMIKIYLSEEEYKQELHYQNVLGMIIREEMIDCVKVWWHHGVARQFHGRNIAYSITEVDDAIMLADFKFHERNTFNHFTKSMQHLLKQMTLIHARGLFHLRINCFNLFYSRLQGAMLVDYTCVNLGFEGACDPIFQERMERYEYCDRFLVSKAFIQSIPDRVLNIPGRDDNDTVVAHIIVQFLIDTYSDKNDILNRILGTVQFHKNNQIYNKVLKNLGQCGLLKSTGEKRKMSDVLLEEGM